MMFLKRVYLWSWVLGGAAMPFLPSCYVETVHEPSNHPTSSEATRLDDSKSHCDSSARSHADNMKDAQCAHDERTTWLWKSECKMGDCQSLDVYVHYMLSQDLGAGMSAVVEAFDNEKFSGSPVSTAIINEFNAKKAGSFEKTNLFLGPGRYYLRAYLSDASSPLPYEYNGMKLIGEKPMGVFGGLSSVTLVDIPSKSGRSFMNTATIHIDKLFQKGDKAKDDEAFLRVLIKTDEKSPVPSGKLVRIGVFHSSDFARVPAVSLTMPSEALAAPTAAGYSELLTGDIPVGTYYVFAYLDTNQNEFYDEDEISQSWSVNKSHPTSLRIESQRTATAKLTLSLNQ